MSGRNFYLERILAIISVIVLLQASYYKLIGHQESVDLFFSLGIEPYGRIIIGVLELIASLLLLFPGTALFGSIIGLSVTLGAIITHIYIPDIEIPNETRLFILAIIVFLCCFCVLYMRQVQLYLIFERIFE